MSVVAIPALTIATMPVFRAWGSSGHASTTAARLLEVLSSGISAMASQLLAARVSMPADARVSALEIPESLSGILPFGLPAAFSSYLLISPIRRSARTLMIPAVLDYTCTSPGPVASGLAGCFHAPSWPPSSPRHTRRGDRTWGPSFPSHRLKASEAILRGRRRNPG